MNRGFTLIELMVSVAIFAVIMTISLGAMLSITTAQRKAETLKSVIDNLHFALDGMSRSIRTGYNYNCGSASGGDCTSGGTAFYFTDAQGRSVIYCRGSGTTCSASGTEILQSIDGSAFSPLTASEAKIGNLSFYLVGSARGNAVQPRVTITASSTVQVSSTQTSSFNMQTTVTQRLYDL